MKERKGGPFFMKHRVYMCLHGLMVWWDNLSLIWKNWLS